MPFRIKVTLAVLTLLAATIVVGPLLLRVPELRDTRPPGDLAYDDSVFVDLAVPGGRPLRAHVQTAPAGRAPGAALGPAGDPVDGVVLLHGFGSGTMTWRHLRSDLEAHVPLVLSMDRPGFGLTERPLPGDWPRGANPYGPEAQVELTLALMDAYGVERAVLVGHSAGGALALDVALAHPERVAALVLLNPAVVQGGGPPAWSRPLLHTPQMARIGPLAMRQLGGEPGENFLRAAYAEPSRLDPIDVDAYRRGVAVHAWDRALWEHVKASRPPRASGHLDRIGVPVLLLAGAEDSIVPLEASVDVAERLPRAELVTLDDCGHLPQEECHAATGEAIVAWLARTF